MEVSRATNGRQVDSEENPNIQPNEKTKQMSLTVNRQTNITLQEDGTGHARPST
jgi:hypothetical protein